MAQNKEHYEKPVLRIIELKADEVMAAGCKTYAAPAPQTAPCDAGGCSALGS